MTSGLCVVNDLSCVRSLGLILLLMTWSLKLRIDRCSRELSVRLISLVCLLAAGSRMANWGLTIVDAVVS